ncbi:solute carrier family 2 [Penicillium canescens]|nr:solute carrier family 2 [Penicillium canescens]
MFGVSLAYWINYGSLVNISSTSNVQWQVPMAMQILPGIIVFFGLFAVPESPRWLANKDRIDDARKSLAKLRQLELDHSFLREELGEIGDIWIPNLEQSQGFNLDRFRQVPNLSKRFILVCLVQVFFQFSGGNIITYYNTIILNSIGFTDPKTNFLFSGIYGLVKVVSVLIYCLYFVDRFGRRPLLWAGSVIIIVTLTYMTIYLGALTHISDSKAASWAAILSIYLYAIGYAISWATVPWIINAEVFPTSVRAPCMAATITWQYLVNFALTRAMPNMLSSMHSYGPFALFACATFVGSFYCFFAFPDTKSMGMEQMDCLFTVKWYRIGLRSVSMGRKQTGDIVDLAVWTEKQTVLEVSSHHSEKV